jgi:hypothetical protein
VTAEPDGGFWFLRIEELPELFTQARFAAEIDYMARDLISISQEVPSDSFDLVLPNIEPLLLATDKSRDALYDRLIALGVPIELASAIQADLGDIERGVAEIQDLYIQIADGRDVGAAFDSIESEARDHLAWHVKSIRKTATKLRRLRRKSKRGGDPQRPFAPLK